MSEFFKFPNVIGINQFLVNPANLPSERSIRISDIPILTQKYNASFDKDTIFIRSTFARKHERNSELRSRIVKIRSLILKTKNCSNCILYLKN